MIVIDFIYCISALLAPAHRSIEVVSYLKASFAPLITIQNDFHEFYEEKKYELIFNGQVIMLEHLLNDLFDEVNREIEIDDSEQTINVYWFNNSDENEENYLFNAAEVSDPYYLFNSSEYDADTDFIIKIPNTVTFDEELLKFYVNKYKCAGMRYIIQIV